MRLAPQQTGPGGVLLFSEHTRGRLGAHAAVMPNARCEAVRRAAAIVDDLYRLGAQLNASLEDLHDWLAGRRSPPVSAFLKAVDIIERHGRSR